MAETQDKRIEAGKAEPKTAAKAEGKFEGRRIVRLLATDIDGSLPVERALRRIKGISFMFAKGACSSMGLDGSRKIGTLSDPEIKQIEAFVNRPQLPTWMLNRRKDPESGADMHLTMSNLDLHRREDINTMKRIRSYKGIRHESGQPVRGQRTRSTFRTQKSVGVMKKKVLAAARAAKPAAPAEGKK